jgi:hypothetical protein
MRNKMRKKKLLLIANKDEKETRAAWSGRYCRENFIVALRITI